MDTYLLHLETATKACSVAVSLNGRTIATIESVDEQYAHGEKLGVYIEQALSQAGIQPKNLSAVSLSSGPGSYTGLRIGSSTAKGICFALDIPLIAIDSNLCIALNAQIKYPNQRILSLIDARRMEAYTQLYDENLQALTDIEATLLDENSFLEFDPFVAVGDGVSKLKESWKNRPIVIDETNFSSATEQASFAYQLFLKEKFVDLAYYEPLYLKDFVAKKPKSKI